jgi:NTP pyrophosphatase (non-canonical NTP hydrolase)
MLINKFMKKNKLPLTFKHFHEMNVKRSKIDVKHSSDWTPMEWCCALGGEYGELANYLKKRRRGDKIPKKWLAHEVADIVTYLSLLCHELDIDMESAIVEKFNIVSKRWGSKIKL